MTMNSSLTKGILENVENMINSDEHTLTECWRCDRYFTEAQYQRFLSCSTTKQPFPHMALRHLNVIGNPEDDLEIRIAPKAYWMVCPA